jgi:hypothetical protein
MEELHLKLSFPREDPAGVLLEEFYPALFVCMADDLLREGAGESARTSSLRCSRWRRRILRPARLFCSTCTSASAPTDAARFQKLIPLCKVLALSPAPSRSRCKAAAVEAAAAAAHLTPDTSDEAPVCLQLSEETRRLAAVGSYRSLERLLDRHHKVGSGAGGVGGGGGLSCDLNRVSVAQRENAATMAPTEHKCCHRDSHSGSICVWSTQHLCVEHAAFVCGAWSTQHLCVEHAAWCQSQMCHLASMVP